jgi:hypothetical protein
MSPDEKSQEGTAEAQELAADLEELLRGAMKQATASIEKYTDYAVKATKRLATGDTDTGDWSKDAAEVGALWLKDMTSAWGTWAQAVNLVAGRKPEDGQQQKGGG